MRRGRTTAGRRGVRAAGRATGASSRRPRWRAPCSSRGAPGRPSRRPGGPHSAQPTTAGGSSGTTSSTGPSAAADRRPCRRPGRRPVHERPADDPHDVHDALRSVRGANAAAGGCRPVAGLLAQRDVRGKLAGLRRDRRHGVRRRGTSDRPRQDPRAGSELPVRPGRQRPAPTRRRLGPRPRRVPPGSPPRSSSTGSACTTSRRRERPEEPRGDRRRRLPARRPDLDEHRERRRALPPDEPRVVRQRRPGAELGRPGLGVHRPA